MADSCEKTRQHPEYIAMREALQSEILALKQKLQKFETEHSDGQVNTRVDSSVGAWPDVSPADQVSTRMSESESKSIDNSEALAMLKTPRGCNISSKMVNGLMRYQTWKNAKN